MSQINAVNWFEIPVQDLDRATSFYQEITGLDLSRQEMGTKKMAWFPMHFGAQGSTGALVKGDGYTPSAKGSVVFLSVQNLEDALSKVANGGGKVVEPKTSIGEYGYIGRILDTEGNAVALHSEK